MPLTRMELWERFVHMETSCQDERIPEGGVGFPGNDVAELDGRLEGG